MRKKIAFLFLAFTSTFAIAQQPSGDTLMVEKTETVKANPSNDFTYAAFDSIRTHASMLYAGRVLTDVDYHLAYANELDQMEWRKYKFGETAFVKGASYDENKQAWKTSKNVPFSYVRLIYDYENQKLCHYQVKFATRLGFSLFHKEAVDAGYLYKERRRDHRDDGVESTYYNAKTNCTIVFGEYSDGQLTVDCWQGSRKFK